MSRHPHRAQGPHEFRLLTTQTDQVMQTFQKTHAGSRVNFPSWHGSGVVVFALAVRLSPGLSCFVFCPVNPRAGRSHLFCRYPSAGPLWLNPRTCEPSRHRHVPLQSTPLPRPSGLTRAYDRSRQRHAPFTVCRPAQALRYEVPTYLPYGLSLSLRFLAYQSSYTPDSARLETHFFLSQLLRASHGKEKPMYVPCKWQSNVSCTCPLQDARRASRWNLVTIWRTQLSSKMVTLCFTLSLVSGY